MVESLSESELVRRHWDRFAAWCAAWGHSPLPADPTTVTAFLDEFSGSASTQRLRRQAIRSHHLAAGYPDPAPPPPEQRVLRTDTEHLERLLTTIPKYRFPAGVRGRRDAFLVVLLGALSLSRATARAIGPDDVAVDRGIRIRGTAVPPAADPAACLACAITRWLRIVGPVWTGFRGDVLRLVDPTKGSLVTHDCAVPLSGEWRRAEQLLLPLDVHGWAQTGRALSERSMTAIVPRRGADAAAGRPAEIVGPVRRTPSRFAHLTTQETYDALGDADDVVDAALARLEAVYAELEHLNDTLHEPPPPNS